MKYKVFWCKVNKYYTDKWLNSSDLKNNKGIFIASCVVTDKAKKKWIKFVIDTSKELEKNDFIYISWCGAFKDWKAQSNFFELYPEIKFLENKIIILWEKPKKQINNTKIPKWIYTKKFLLIQWWCDSFCTFCLTVKKRWRHYSRNKEEIVKEILDFELEWWKEVVLTWVNLCAWWLKSTNILVGNEYFHSLLLYILDKTNIQRIRISSLWPEFINDDILEIFKNKRIYPHFHFSVQSWSNNILKSMARHYDWDYIKKLLLKTKNIKREDWVDISIWADLIIWFPWETLNDFNDTYNLIKEIWIQKLHVFPFSPHTTWESVPAWSFKNQIPEKIKKERISKILEIWNNIRNDFIISQKWKTMNVLIEYVKWDKWKGWSENYIEATNDNFKVIVWDIKRNEIVSGEFY